VAKVKVSRGKSLCKNGGVVQVLREINVLQLGKILHRYKWSYGFAEFHAVMVA
tara:strand:+ start:70 stop:228 length:159 start_codon:yes stop_codon:yes gene_type:complete